MWTRASAPFADSHNARCNEGWDKRAVRTPQYFLLQCTVGPFGWPDPWPQRLATGGGGLRGYPRGERETTTAVPSVLRPSREPEHTPEKRRRRGS